MKSEKIIFNHFYKLRHDIHRSYIMSPTFVDKQYEPFVNKEWISKIHPIFPMIFSFFSQPIELQEAIKVLSDFLEISETDVENFITPYINNKETTRSMYGNVENYFPKNILINADLSFCGAVDYMPEQFAYEELNLEQERFIKAPATIVFMVNNTCLTDCVYCYANKLVKNKPITFEQVKEIVLEAKKLQIQKFTLDGGEFFLYKQWKELLDFLLENGFQDSLISTKVPITEGDIVFLKKFDIPIQISLDSINPNKLTQILDVKSDYAEKIKKTISFLDKHNVSFQVATILTKYNDSIENLEELYDFVQNFRSLRKWEIRVGFKSMYSRGNFDEIKTSKDSVEKINQWVEETKKSSKIYIQWVPEVIEKYFETEGGSKNFKGGRCSANYSNIFVLPDGKVTICEQLYWNPRFIIGDLTTQTIEEVWNSPRALELAFPKKENFRNASICKKCSIFDDCYKYHNKCYVDVIKGYGDENWDFPDPRCKFAPEFIYNLNPE
ncbi:MAG: radical SAM protein [Prevotellaceae bacterium]|jgi:radical SAM protein with 4Fe4S-binding SPASM domain|nr:radical SAM protein [Prevotellaceae bacterium]